MCCAMIFIRKHAKTTVVQLRKSDRDTLSFAVRPSMLHLPHALVRLRESISSVLHSEPSVGPHNDTNEGGYGAAAEPLLDSV